MNIYFLIICVMYLLRLGVALAEHGKEREGRYSFWATLIASLIGITLIWLAINN